MEGVACSSVCPLLSSRLAHSERGAARGQLCLVPTWLAALPLLPFTSPLALTRKDTMPGLKVAVLGAAGGAHLPARSCNSRSPASPPPRRRRNRPAALAPRQDEPRRHRPRSLRCRPRRARCRCRLQPRRLAGDHRWLHQGRRWPQARAHGRRPRHYPRWCPAQGLSASLSPRCACSRRVGLVWGVVERPERSSRRAAAGDCLRSLAGPLLGMVRCTMAKVSLVGTVVPGVPSVAVGLCRRVWPPHRSSPQSSPP